jgi:hypothetical protein
MRAFDENVFKRAALAGDWPGVVEALHLQSYPLPFPGPWFSQVGMSTLDLKSLYVEGDLLLQWAAACPGVPVEIVRLLMVKAFGKMSFLCDEDGHTALHQAVLSRRKPVVAMMAKEGFVRAIFSRGLGEGLLRLAVKCGSLTIVKKIFWSRRPWDHVSTAKRLDPLWNAVSAGYPDITRFLLSQGADPIYCAEQWRARIKDHGVIYADDTDCFELIKVSRWSRSSTSPKCTSA